MKIPSDVLAVLDRAETEGPALRLTGQLDRNLYTRTNKALEAAGGKWNRKAKAHMFDGDAADAIEQILLTGEITTVQDLGFFPTPPAIVEQLLDLADVKPGMVVLEPSAGRGAIAGPIAARGAVVDCAELLPDNAAVIEAAGYAQTLAVGDFLSLAFGAEYDRVVMNPPFARQADIDHVNHALACLKPGGLLVSVMSASVTFRANTKASGFRARVEDRGGQFIPLPEGAFKASGTGVNTVIAVIPNP